MIEVLDNFCNLVGQKVSKNKSRILFSQMSLEEGEGGYVTSLESMRQ